MRRSSKRPKLNDYYERGSERAGSVSSEQDDLQHDGAQHSGEGVQNINGSFRNGRDFNMLRFYSNNVLVNPPFSPQTPTATDSSTTINKEEHRHNLIESLKFAQIDSRRGNIKKAHGKTCKWFLKTTQYIEWLDINKFEDHGGFLWVKGKPGAGKSTLMKFTFSHVHRTFRNSGNVILSFFFNARGEELEKSTIGLYRSLLSQLLEQRPCLQCILDRVKPGHQWDIRSLELKLEEAICLMEKRSIYCFIDALDECEEQLIRSMLKFLQGVSKQAACTGAKLHVCLASRHYPHITIEKGRHLIVEGRGEHQQDIGNYLDAELLIGHTLLAEQIRSNVREKASGVFMWVVLVVDILNKEYDRGRIHSLSRRLKDIPSDLHDLIHNILTRDHDNTHGLLLCIQWVLFSKRPLTPKELYFAIMSGVEPECLTLCGLEGDLSADDIQRNIIYNSKGLAELTKADIPTIQFIHESVRDFLLKENGLQKIWPELEFNLRGKSHDKLKECCLVYMSNKIVNNFFLPDPLPKANSLDAASLRQGVGKALPFLEYAIQNVLYHSDRAESDGLDQRKFLEESITPNSSMSPHTSSHIRFHSFSLDAWRLYNDLFETRQVRRYTQTPSLLYILAEHNLPDLIRIPNLHQGCFDLEKGTTRYGAPIFAALASKSNEALQALLQIHVQKSSQSSTLHKTYNDFIDFREHETSTFGRRFQFKSDIVSALISEKEFAILDIYLATHKIDLNIGKTSTHLNSAIHGGSEATVQILLKHGANPNLESSPSLPLAVRNRAEAIVQVLIENGARVNATFGGQTPLSLAAEIDHEAISVLLLDAGADIESVSGDRPPRRINALISAVQNGSASVAQALFERGSEFNMNELFSIALHPGISDNSAVIQVLLNNSSMTDINLATAPLMRLLQHTIDYDDITRTTYILENSPDILAEIKTSPRIGWFRTIASGREAMVRLLLHFGTFIGESLVYEGLYIGGNPHRVPPLYTAINYGREAIVRILLDHGVNVEGNGWGISMSPLYAAVYIGNETIVTMLLDHGANVEGQSLMERPLDGAVNYISGADERTPLARAVSMKSVGMTQLLLAAGADAKVRDDYGTGLLSIPDLPDDLARMLMDYGATF